MIFLKNKWLALGIFSFSIFALLNFNNNAFAKYKISKYFQKSPKIYNPLDDIVWTKVGDYGSVKDIGSKHYIDVISHTDPNDAICPRSSGMAFSPASIRIHETEHMLNCQIQRTTGSNNSTTEGLYYSDGNGIIFTKPKLKVTDFSKLIPSELIEKPSPYQTYIIDQMKHPSLNNIGYLFNEWASYRSNILLNLELEKVGKPESESDSPAANYSPHFFGYLAIAMHQLRIAEPEALNDKQLKAAFALYAESSWQLMRAGLFSPVFGKENTMYGSHIRKLMSFYRYSPKFEEVRKSLTEIYGKEWVEQLMYGYAPN